MIVLRIGLAFVTLIPKLRSFGIESSVLLTLIDSAFFMIGTKLAHYEITSHLGTGGMGEVYQATDGRLGRSVAIKLLPQGIVHNHDSASASSVRRACWHRSIIRTSP